LNNKLHIKKGDIVQIISGKDKRKTGKITKSIPKKYKVIVENINIVKRHTKPSQENAKGGIIEKSAPISSSKVLLYCSNCKTGVRAGKKILENGKKVRYCKKCNEVLDK
jgi:large subunit ribosomal protein L24